MNYKTNDSINVLFASDDNFAPYLGVAIYSFLKNNHQDFRKINIHILAKRISKENKTILEEIASPFGENNLIFIEDEGISKILGKKIQANRALSSFSRLFAASFLDETIEKVLYLDADSLILGSFKELWETNIENLNAGVLLINLKKWRNEDVESKFIDFLEKNNMQVYNNDQGIINATLNDSILIVDPKFNLMSPFLEKDYDDVIKWNGLKNYYDKETIENAIKNPVFLHFVHFINGRPWFKDTKHPCKDLYLKYASETQYKNDVVVEDYRGLKYKLFFSLTNFLPYKLVCLIYRPYRDFFIKYF